MTDRLAALRAQLTIAERHLLVDPDDPTRRETVRRLRSEILALMRTPVRP